MPKCDACGQNLSPTKHATCASCQNKLHLNAECSGLQPSTWNSKSRANKEAWVCSDCRVLLGSKTTRSNSLEERSLGAKRKKLDMDPPADGISYSEDRLMEKIANLFEEKISQHFEEQREFIKEELNERFENIEAETRAIRIDVAEVRSDNDEQKQYSMRNNLLFSNVPEVEGEKPIETVDRIAKALNLNMTEQDVDACHRLPNRNSKNKDAPRTFIIKFCRRMKKTDILIEIKKTKPKQDAFGGNRDIPIYVNEHLTARTTELFRLARRLREKNFRVETRDCAVFVQQENQRRKKISSKEQIVQILAEYGLAQNL